MDNIVLPPHDPKNLQKGTIISKQWRIKRKIGEGGFGAVYKVVNVETETSAALKIETHNKREVLKLEAKVKRLFGRTCSVSAQVRIGINTLYAIKQLHDSGFVHRDLKPANMAVGPVGTPEFRFIHIFDFGLARQYVVTSDSGPPKLRKPRPRAHFRGTLRYCSINCHERGEQGRDDDLWCLLYLLVELRGALPWTKSSFSDPYDWELKASIPTESA
uniref:Protein kinase domain-containing protein n=1 Tax=Angiostrongylus cantonensis TaxID=6313 RepID=A0A0K0CUV3_ANGCA